MVSVTKRESITDQLRYLENKLRSKKSELYRFSGQVDDSSWFNDLSLRLEFSEEGDKFSINELHKHQQITMSSGYRSTDIASLLFVKRSSLAELIASLVSELDNHRSISSFVLLRPILEYIALTSSFADDADATDTETILNLATDENPEEDMLSGLAFYEITPFVAKKLMPQHSDVFKLLKNDLHANKPLPFRNKGDLDFKAEGVTKFVDALGDKVSGVKRLYQLASEVAHPNFAVSLAFHKNQEQDSLGVDRDDEKSLSLIKTSYSNQIEVDVLDAKLDDSLHVVIESIEYFLACEARILNFSRRAQDQFRSTLRKYNRHWKRRTKKAFLSNSSICPCKSGKVFGNCCGR